MTERGSAKQVELVSFLNSAELAATVAREWLLRAQQQNPFHVALSGGRIAAEFFRATTAEVQRSGKSLKHVHFFWADERCVPPENPESNFALANKLLFEPLGIGGNQIHRIRGELAPALAAAEAEKDIRRAISSTSSGHPVLDLVFLGMGEDGHVASLFPNSSGNESDAPFGVPPLGGQARTYIDVIGPKPPPNRVSLTYDALRAASDVWVLVSGAGKETALKESLQGGNTPLGRVIAQRTKTKVHVSAKSAY